ncbi:GntR family transcriptional regulator [Streptomyces sp. ID05-04B]|uniref:GntR family transcriptional regulator n=1 Tax=Streptomyces sp. ID05-04B TaxID=3028661 RepID=UPI0029CA2A08|nr:GntR family transcriptional regulator [Streptomyces sp. ID05-04B]
MTVPNDRFAIPDTRPGETALYQFFNEAEQLLYVGITGNPQTRWADHRRYAATTWWPLAVRVTVGWFADRTEAVAAELQVIRTAAPLYNSGGAPSPHREQRPGERLCPRVNMERFYEATRGGFHLPGRPWRNMDTAVAETIAEDIANGELPEGSPMPSATELVNRFGVSVNTARRAIRQLVVAGEVEARGLGSGTRYFVTIKQKPQQGDPMPTTTDPRANLYAFAMLGKEHSPSNSDAASEKINAFRAAVLREAADALDESEVLRDFTDDHMSDVNATTNELRRMADEHPQGEEV